MKIKDYIKFDGNKGYLQIKVTTRSRENKFYNIMDDGTLKVRVKAVPENGKANKELIKFLAFELDINKNDIEIISGAGDVRKIVRVNCKTPNPLSGA